MLKYSNHHKRGGGTFDPIVGLSERMVQIEVNQKKKKKFIYIYIYIYI